MKDVIILGTGPSNIRCPYDTKVWSVYGMIFHGLGKIERLDARRLDRILITDEQQCADSDVLLRRQKEYGFEFMTGCRWDGVPSTPYPIEEILQHFGTAYFEDSICFLIALAIYEGYEKLRIYGVDCGWYTYAVTERNCTEFWLGVARGRGLQVELSRESSSLFNLPGEDTIFCTPMVEPLAEFRGMINRSGAHAYEEVF